MTDLTNKIGAGITVSASIAFAGVLLFLSGKDAEQIIDQSVGTCENLQQHEPAVFNEVKSINPAEYENCRQHLEDIVNSTDRTSRAELAGQGVTIEFRSDFNTVSDSTAAAYFNTQTKQLHINLAREFDSQVQALDELGEMIGKQTGHQAAWQDATNNSRSIIFGSLETKANVQASSQPRP